jgi:7,8-dihydropterin-6-yl-methyl-4-(beta-D-ribofuranosyl)aminobenzene 5'-phosphate synthase
MKKIISITLLGLAGLSVTALLFFFTRQALAKSEIEHEWEKVPAIVPPLETTSQLEIIPLYEEAGADNNFIIGHGVSYLIRTDSATVLMDVGNNPEELRVAPFMQNMQKLGIDWNEIDRIVISHPHPDHLGGETAWRQNTVSFGELPGRIGERLVFVPTDIAYEGAIHATIPTLPGPDIATTGVISFPEVFPFSLSNPKGGEQALVVHVANEGLVLITGCGHPTLERLVTRAETLYGHSVIGVIGGLHYEEATAADVQPHIQFLQSRQLQLVALSPHDSSPQALAAFKLAFREAYHELMVGNLIQFPVHSAGENSSDGG